MGCWIWIFQWTDDNGIELSVGNFDVNLPETQRTIIDEIPVTPPVATATMAPFSTDLNDVFISVKTTRHYHYSRLPSIIATWFQHAKDQVCYLFFFYVSYYVALDKCHMISHFPSRENVFLLFRYFNLLFRFDISIPTFLKKQKINSIWVMMIFVFFVKILLSLNVCYIFPDVNPDLFVFFFFAWCTLNSWWWYYLAWANCVHCERAPHNVGGIYKKRALV